MKRTSLLRILAICFAVTLLCTGLVACGGDKPDSTPDSSAGTSDDPGSSAIGDPSGTPTDPTGEEPDPTDPGGTNAAGTTGSGASAATKTGGNKTTAPAKTTGKTQTPSTGKLANDKIVDMNGYTFSIMSVFLPTKLSKNSTLFEEQLFQRIDEVQKQYNCKIKIINTPYPDLATIKKYVLAKRKFADIIELAPRDMVAAAEAGYLLPWDGVSPLDTSDPRWIAQGTSLGNYNGKQYGLSFYRPPEVRACIVINKTLLANNGIDPNTIYDAVKKGTWTFDKLREMAVACTKSDKGTFGIIGYPDYMADGLMKANNARLVTRQSNGKAVFTGSSTAAVTAMQYLYDLVNTQKCVYVAGAALGTDAAWDTVYRSFDPVKKFLEGKYAFMLHESWTLNQQIKAGAQKAGIEYGMVPYPKGPNADKYYGSAMNARLFCRISSNKDYEKSAIIFNALARPADDIIDYDDDVQADYFQSNDKRSIEMYKLLLANSTFDIGEGVNELLNAFNAQTATSVYAHTTTVKAGLEAMNGKYDAAINAIFNR